MPEELMRFKQALDGCTPLTRDFFWMCLLVGARRGNVQAMRWSEIDITLKIWQYEQKNGEVQVSPLTDAALAILERRKGCDPVWVFPSPKIKGAHLKEPGRSWDALLKRSGIKDLTIHDLRRTVGSYLAIDGFTEVVIGETLGHKDRRSTKVYARLNVQPIRLALQAVENRIVG